MNAWHLSRTLVLALGLLAAASFSAPQSSPTQEGRAALEAQFHELEQGWMDALAAKDKPKLEATLAAEFSIVGAGSTVDDVVGERAAWLELAMQMPWPKHEVRIVKVTRVGETAVVQCVLTGEYPPMPWIPDGGTLQFLTTDTWVDRDGRWQVIARHSSLPPKPQEAGDAPPADEPVVVKEKAGRILVKDKSKPVRRALEIQYERLAEAVESRDFEAFQALRTADFHTLDEHGNPHTPQQMAERARAMLQRIQPPIETHNDILVIELRGSDATATVRQYFSKMLPLAGQLRKVETWVTQDETWTLTPEGWKLSFVENVRDGETYVDGKRIDPSLPYNPDAPPYEPLAASTAPAHEPEE